MRISELYKPKELDQFRQEFEKDSHYRKFSSMRNLNEIMEKYGFQKIGEGFYASVYQHPKYKDSVFKIFYDDPKTLEWLKYCLKKQNNPYIPKLKAPPVKITKGLYLVRMEKLYFKDAKTQEFIYGELFDMLSRIGIENIRANHKSGHVMLDQESLDLINDPVFEKTMTDIEKINGTDGHMDIHHGNFMWRGNQLVLTDPVAS